MTITQSRRRFVANSAVAGAAAFGALGALDRGDGGKSLAAEPPPEISTIRLERGPITCIAPQMMAEELLHAEGFIDVRYVESDLTPVQKLARDEVDRTTEFAAVLIEELDRGAPLTIVAGVHVGCFELFAHEHIRSVADLKGRTVGVPPSYETPRQLVSIMASYVGMDPRKDIDWISDPLVKPMDLFIGRKIDAFLASTPRAQELRARGIGHSLVNSSIDRPWSQYFCCVLIGRTDFVRKYPVATKRVVRAMLKATDLCATEPDRVAQSLIDRGFIPRSDYVLPNRRCRAAGWFGLRVGCR